MSGPVQEQSAAEPSDAHDGASVRFVIDGGGAPDDAEIAALAIALTPVRAEAPREAVDAWRRAALTEGVGGRRALAPADLHAAVDDRWG